MSSMSVQLERALFFARSYRAVAEEFAADCPVGPHRTLEALVELDEEAGETDRERLLRDVIDARRGELSLPMHGRWWHLLNAAREFADHLIAEEDATP